MRLNTKIVKNPLYMLGDLGCFQFSASKIDSCPACLDFSIVLMKYLGTFTAGKASSMLCRLGDEPDTFLPLNL